MLHFLWAAGSVGDSFAEIQQGEMGNADLTELRLEVNLDVGNAAGALDFRLLELTLHSDSLPADPVFASEVAGKTRSEEPANSGNDWVLVAVGLGGLGVVGLGVVGALALWLTARRRRLGKTLLHAPVQERPATLNPAAPVSFACASCGKTLKARAELAGKKVKCSQCGKPVPVPGTKAVETA